MCCVFSVESLVLFGRFNIVIMFVLDMLSLSLRILGIVVLLWFEHGVGWCCFVCCFALLFVCDAVVLFWWCWFECCCCGWLSVVLVILGCVTLWTGNSVA